MSGQLLSCNDARRNPCTIARGAAAAPAALETPGRLGSWLGWLSLMLRAIETRRQLAEMDDRMLKDIGLSRGNALIEAERAPWDLGPRGM